MRKSILLLCVYASVSTLRLTAQSVTKYEYWTNHHTGDRKSGWADGGIIDFDADMSQLGMGFHVFSFRMQDSEGNWSVPYTKMFYRTQTVDRLSAIAYEYWTDHSVANVRRGTVSNGLIELDADLSELPEGFHTLTLRTQDGSGAWSVPYTKMFYRTQTVVRLSATAYEYWTDHNVANVRGGTVSNGLIELDADLSELPEGFHTLTLRTQDGSGAWSVPYTKMFYRMQAAEPRQTVACEYYIDHDAANRKRMDTDAAGLVNIDVDASGLADGIHTLSFRTQDTSGAWSTPCHRLFAVERCARIMGYEYWFNKDYDLRVFEQVEPVDVYHAKNVQIDVTPVWNDGDEEAENVFHIRFRNTKGEWSELISHTFTKGQLQMELADYEILKAFYHATGGENWTEQWDISSSEIHAGQWNGVNFKEGKVYDIFLPDNNLTGKLPAEIFMLSNLESISLDGNRLSGRIDSLFADNGEDTVSELLTSVSLSGNELHGDVSPFAYSIPSLRKLNVSGNRLTEISNGLPDELTDIDLASQFVEYVNEQSGVPTLVRNTPTMLLPLGESMAIPLNSLQMYGMNVDAEGNSNMPDYLITDKTGSIRLPLRYDSDEAVYKCRLDREWHTGARDTLIAVQQSGLAKGYAMNVLLDFKSGDANIDHTVDVLDVQHTLNYILTDGNGSILPFNFIAADTFCDSLITVQDMVRTIGIVLDTDFGEMSMAKRRSLYSAGEVADARLYVQQGRLMLDTSVPVAAMDIIIDNASEGEVRMLTDKSRFATVFRQKDNCLRMLVYSPSGDMFANGCTELAELGCGDARIVNATLADTDARYVSVSFADIASGVDIAQADADFDLQFDGEQLTVRMSDKSRQMIVDIIDMQGRVLATKEYSAQPTGTFVADIPPIGEGVYIVRASNGEVSKTLKIRK
ncbi:MAG: T9SS type A sorting domain-containing protein [Bacteroides sp.]|nr:T9SS type A sorting domain-containing protein [Roseburia sp.]MCM1347254.1 T9SS type A sorting domain-containing protein [Bacteroides sp.]MCM1421780.1 T9SS type A sorting domain-containing protein [Bacteroides sp.]